MKRWGLRALSLVGSLMLAGCYHAIIETGRPASSDVLHKPWAPSFIGGLVPPSPVEVASRCPNGVSRVDTQLSFLNMLVGGITFGIFTPMDIKVTCAAAGNDDSSLASVRVDGDVAGALARAVALSRATGQAVLAKY